MQFGYCALIWIANSIPEIPGMATSDMTKSGDSERAAANASSGDVKNLAEKPFIRNMAVILDAVTGSSLTTKTCEPERGYTWGLFRVFLRVRQLFSRVSVFLGLTRILFTIAHTSGSPNWTEAQVSCCGQILHRAGVNITG